MSIRERLEIATLQLDHSIVLPTPPACNALLQHAQADGLAIGQLFILSRPLHPGLRGGYERPTGDLWCHYWAGETDGERLLLQTLLVLFAHVKLQIQLQQPIPTTVDDDWQQEQEAWNMAFQLATAWNVPELLSESELAQRIEESERLHTWHLAAAELAGVSDPALARAAYHALADIRQKQQWNDEQFEAALFGYSEELLDNASVLAFDRTALRATWSIPYRSRREGPPFGNATIPYSRQTISLLRSALESAGCHHGKQIQLRAINRKWLDEPLSLHFLRIDSDLEFPGLVACCNAWLIEEAPNMAAEATWWLYSSEALPMRVYRLCVRYKPAWHDTPSEPPASGHELWVLFPGDARGRMIESAFQRYILCWLSVQEVRVESLEIGLAYLWGWLNQECDHGEE